MNELRDLFAVPAEREMPPAVFAWRKAALVQVVAEDLGVAACEATTRRRRHRLRAWLAGLGITLVLIGIAASALLTTDVRPQSTRTAVEVATALGSGSVLASLSALPRHRPACSSLQVGEGRCLLIGGRTTSRMIRPAALA